MASSSSALVASVLASALVGTSCSPRASVFTAPDTFTAGVEGPAVDAAGNLYAVNFAREGTIGRVTPGGEAHVYVELPEGSTGNGIRFGESGTMYVADYTGHNVLRVDPATRKVSVLAHEPAMSQPNDLAIAPDGSIYLSDPDWAEGTGRLWRATPAGDVELLGEGMGTTNGIEVSPDGHYLYVNESVQRRLWRYRIDAGGGLSAKQLLRTWDDHGLDGMRFGPDGLLYVTRHGKGTVEAVTPGGAFAYEVALAGAKPSNIAFGGRGGRTAYVTVADRGNVERFRVRGRSTRRD